MDSFQRDLKWDTGLKGKTKEEMEEKSELEGMKPVIPVISGRATIQQFCQGSKFEMKALQLFFFQPFITQFKVPSPETETPICSA